MAIVTYPRRTGILDPNNLVIGKTSGTGIKVDEENPTWGWRDMVGQVFIKATGVNDPVFSVFSGNLRAFEFSAAAMKEVYVNYHIPHDYVPGTDLYFHTHWANAAAIPNTGNVIWGFEYSYARGHQQQAFAAPTTVTVTQACDATRYWHHIAETTIVTIPNIEPDGLIMMRVYRDAAAVGDTLTDTAFLLMTDVHYQSTNIATKQKSPNFYN